MPTNHREVPVRHPDFTDGSTICPNASSSPSDTVGAHLVAVLSAIFPPGEEYFVRAVERVRDRIDDPELARQVEGFIGQEDMHGDRHRKLNERLAELGYPMDTIDRYIGVVARWADRRLSPMTNLAITSALEHHTAIVAETLLGEKAARDLMTDDTVRHLFCWHALEESEHKAVAFDVYRHLGGSERRRIWSMHAMNVGFALEVAVWTLCLAAPRPRDVAPARRSRPEPPHAPALAVPQPEHAAPAARLQPRGLPPRRPRHLGSIARFRRELFGDDGRLAAVTPDADREVA